MRAPPVTDRPTVRHGSALRVLHVIWWGEVGGIALNLVDLARHARAAGHAMTVCVLTRSSPLIDALAEHDVCIAAMRARSGRDLGALMRFYRWLRGEAFDVVHDHTGTWLAAVAIRFGASSARRIHQEHGAINLPHLRARKRMFYRMFGGLYDRFIAVSRMIAEDMTRAGIARNRIETITNAVDPVRFSPDLPRRDAKRALGIPEMMLTIGSACRLVPEKDLPLFLDVARIISAERVDVGFVLVGGGPEAEPLRRRARDLGILHAVRFTGERSDMATVWRAFDVYLFTSRVESFGRTLLESLACETPVVAALPLEGGAIDLVRESPGILAGRDRDPEHLATAIRELLEAPAVRATMGRLGRRWVTTRHHVAGWVGRLDALYRTGVAVHADDATAVRNLDTIEDMDATR